MNTVGLRAAFLAVMLVPGVGASSAGAESVGPSVGQVESAAVLSPMAAALRAELGAHYQPGSEVSLFYQARGFEPVWLDSRGAPAPVARALLDWVRQADTHGLPGSRYGLERLSAKMADSSAAGPAGAAVFERELTTLYLRYARDLSSGVLEPSWVSRDIHVEPPRPAPGTLLAGVAAAPDAAGFLAGLAPVDPQYARLVALYAAMREIAREGGWGAEVEGGKTLRLGDVSPRVVQLRARLDQLGDIGPAVSADARGSRDVTVVASNEVMNDAAPAKPDPDLFDAALEASVRRFQERHGLNVDGAVGPATLAAMNTGAAERAAQAAVNLERLRWLNHRPAGREIVVNIAGFSMAMYENGKPIFQTRTVVGQARRHQTPEFNDHLEYMVVNPIWNVPYSIASEEILPLLQENPNYLSEHNMVLVGSDMPASEIDWATVSRHDFPGRIKQLPGDNNALGYVKFLFPNNHSVYMHDTPSRRLFARDRRDFSHGCVRLQDPYDFARLLLTLQDDPVADPQAEFERLRARPGEQWVKLDDPIPVYLTYRTAWVDDEGQPQFRADIYRRDRAVSEALREAGVAIGG